ncbi:hypothetical protein V7166_17505 [Bacillus thuringiensis]
MTSMNIAIATQDLLMTGWMFVVAESNGEATISEAYHLEQGTVATFDSSEDFADWLLKKAKEIREEDTED